MSSDEEQFSKGLRNDLAISCILTIAALLRPSVYAWIRCLLKDISLEESLASDIISMAAELGRVVESSAFP